MDWKYFSRIIRSGFTQTEMRKIRQAFIATDRDHEGQFRDDGSPYADHPKEAALEAFYLGERDVEIIIILLRHDSIEETKGKEKPVTSNGLAIDHGNATAYRIWSITKDDHTASGRENFWKKVHASDYKSKKAKCYDRLNNIRTFGAMIGKGSESKEVRIKRKLDETVKEFKPMITWLANDVKARHFKNKEARRREALLIKRLYLSMRKELARYHVDFKADI